MLDIAHQLPSSVQTLRGTQLIQDINFDSLVFIDYLTGTPIKGNGLTVSHSADTFRLHYSDGRSAFYRNDDYLYLDNQIVQMREVINALSNLADCSNGAIGSRDRYLDFYSQLLNGYRLIGADMVSGLSIKPGAPIPYHRGTVVGEIKPDPYVAGYIFPYADMTDEFVNVPDDRVTMLDSVCLMANIKPCMAEGRKFYFINSSTKQLVRWEDFMSKEVWKSYTESAPNDIPNVYIYGDEASRWEFIRGAFDAGTKIAHGIKVADMEVEIKNFINRRDTLATIIRSLGFLVDTFTVRRNDCNIHSLRVIDTGERFHKFFNDVETANRIQQHVNSLQNLYDGKVYITGIEYVGRSSGYKITLSGQYQPRVIYEGNFLPRVVSIMS